MAYRAICDSLDMLPNFSVADFPHCRTGKCTYLTCYSLDTKCFLMFHGLATWSPGWHYWKVGGTFEW